ncbi:LLM class flavin-dependent oxidoreductase [Paenibacillus protaetiae]|uniref:LLM class flavin-dependent oxidoreductase n=1 Tax=Paenibacillus protaetiae TaxID=2509456 RepID=A0A4P6EYS1_9BACL|nr:LLM class flavin-dependent oxidoreductase [Paenibacillus protaetiae]QAY66939.1 LLM class flavin-dependent oxidoreductase [Paenibacillus protaetiae]
MIKLGVLDQVYVSEGRTATDGLYEAARLAQEAERLGYSRFWVSEHHAMRALAFSSPEVLIAHLAAATKRIRVGSGGIMLPHYSAYKVAENFRLLEALHPGRIDLGLGRAPGGMPLATRALQQDKYVDVNKFPQQVLDLIGYLHDAMPPGHQFEKLVASPVVPTAPEIWLLGSSGEGARIAAMLGTNYAFAEFFGTPGGQEATHYYNNHFEPNHVLEDKPRSMIATLAICAETEEEADRLARSADLLFLGIRTGLEMPYMPSVQTATDYPYTEMDRLHIQQIRQRRIIGTPEQVKEQLLRMGEEYNVGEILINSPIHDPEARIRSYELIAHAFGMRGE